MSTATSPQHLTALSLANEIRVEQCRILRQLRDQETTAAEILCDPPAALERMTVGKLLSAQHWWSPRRTRHFLSRLVIGENRPVGRLTKRQRTCLISELERRDG